MLNQAYPSYGEWEEVGREVGRRQVVREREGMQLGGPVHTVYHCMVLFTLRVEDISMNSYVHLYVGMCP